MAASQPLDETERTRGLSSSSSSSETLPLALVAVVLFLFFLPPSFLPDEPAFRLTGASFAFAFALVVVVDALAATADLAFLSAGSRGPGELPGGGEARPPLRLGPSRATVTSASALPSSSESVVDAEVDLRFRGIAAADVLPAFFERDVVVVVPVVVVPVVVLLFSSVVANGASCASVRAGFRPHEDRTAYLQ